MINCKTCKRPQIECPGADWYSPQEIRFCRVQVMWIICNLPLMREGIWPRHPDGEAAAPLVQHSRGHSAYFETPGQIGGEVDYRLNGTGLEGKLLVAELGMYREVPYLELSDESKRALNYMAGWRRKLLAYSAWKKQRVYRGKKMTTQK